MDRVVLTWLHCTKSWNSFLLLTRTWQGHPEHIWFHWGYFSVFGQNFAAWAEPAYLKHLVCWWELVNVSIPVLFLLSLEVLLMNCVVLKSCFSQSQLCVVIRGLGLAGHCIFCCQRHRIGSVDNISSACKVPNRENAAKAGRRQGQRVSLLHKGALGIKEKRKKRAKNGGVCLHVYPLPQECGAEPVPLVLPAEKKPGWHVRRNMVYFPKACSDAGGCRKPT